MRRRNTGLKNSPVKKQLSETKKGLVSLQAPFFDFGWLVVVLRITCLFYLLSKHYRHC
jgi:hypothetical protein